MEMAEKGIHLERVVPVGALDLAGAEVLDRVLVLERVEVLVLALVLEPVRDEARARVLHLEPARDEARAPALQRWARRTKPVGRVKRT